MSYFDKYGMLSDRPDKISGNQPYYSALHCYISCNFDYWKSIGFTLQNELVFHRFIPKYRLLTKRYPDNPNPDSHDNMIAHIYFGSLDLKDLKRSNWYFNNYHKDDHTWVECFRDIYRLIKEHGTNPHRNIWWVEGYNAIGKIANRLPMWLRWYASRELRYLPFLYLHLFTSWIKPNFKKDVRQTNNVSAKIQCWFILNTSGYEIFSFLFPIKKLVNIYFDYPDHPIRKLLNE